MPLRNLWVEGYRSIRRLQLPLAPLTVILGANGAGKTNVYQVLRLLTAAAEGKLAHTLAGEGGLPSVLWAGPRKRSAPARLTVGIEVDDLAYELRCGPIPEPGSAFELDPDVKQETMWIVDGAGKHVVAERIGASAHVLDATGTRVTFPFELWGAESLLAQLAEPQRFPLLGHLREVLLRCRFYHQFRTDSSAPARHPQVGVRTVALAHDGADLAAALATIEEIGDRALLHASFERAFPGSHLLLRHDRGRFSLGVAMPSLTRPLDAAELSDGTLRFLCLVAALLSPRTPPMLVLNEPEASLHVDLLPALAALIASAAQRGQVILTTHSEPLAHALQAERGNASVVHLVNSEGATVIS